MIISNSDKRFEMFQSFVNTIGLIFIFSNFCNN